jgi:O-antigen/teichoic acid export membrane protein
MFITLLAVTFLIAFVVSSVVVIVFGRPIGKILGRIISDEISKAWLRYLKFAIYVTGISSGVRIWDLEE